MDFEKLHREESGGFWRHDTPARGFCLAEEMLQEAYAVALQKWPSGRHAGESTARVAGQQGAGTRPLTVCGAINDSNGRRRRLQTARSLRGRRAIGKKKC